MEWYYFILYIILYYISRITQIPYQIKNKYIFHNKHKWSQAKHKTVELLFSSVWYMICALNKSSGSCSYTVSCRGGRGFVDFAMSSGIKKEQHIRAPGHTTWSPYTILALHHSEPAPLDYCQIIHGQPNDTELTKHLFRKDYNFNRKPFDYEFVWNVINTVIVPGDQQKRL